MINFNNNKLKNTNVDCSIWEDETYLLLPKFKFDEKFQHEDENQSYKEEIESLFEKRKLFFIVLFKYIKVKFYLFSFEKSFVKKLSINNFTLFSIGYINEYQANVYKHKKFFKYLVYTTI